MGGRERGVCVIVGDALKYGTGPGRARLYTLRGYKEGRVLR